MPRLTETQSLILSRAAARPGALAMPLPEGLHGAAAAKVVTLMLARGWLEESGADPRKGEPLWRETGDGHGITLIATAAGLEAIGIEPVVAGAVATARKPMSAPEAAADVTDRAAAKQVAIRAGTKQAQIIALLQRPEGAAIPEIVAETGWQAHSVRGVISGALKKKLGLPITTEQVAGRGRCYRLAVD